MKFPAAAMSLIVVAPVLASPEPLEVRFCPATAVHTYPLESQRDLQSILLQNVAVITTGTLPIKRAASPFSIDRQAGIKRRRPAD
jgi:hypothetical protein